MNVIRRVAKLMTSVLQHGPAVRTRLAVGWRRLIRIATILLGVSLFAYLQYCTANAIMAGAVSRIIMAYLAIICLVVILARPYMAVMGWLILGPWVNLFIHEDIAGQGTTITFTNFMLPVLGMSLLVRALLNRHRVRPFSTGEWLLFLSFIYAYAVPIVASPHSNTGEYANSILGLFKTPFAMYFITKACFREEKQFTWALYALFAMGLLWGFTGWFEHETGYMWLKFLGYGFHLQNQDAGTGRVRGPADHLYTYGAVNILCTFIAFHLAGCTKNMAAKLAYYACAVMMVFALFFCYTRGAYIAFAFALLVMPFFMRVGRPRYVAAAAVTALVVLGAAGTLLQNPKFERRMEDPGNVQERIYMDKTAINVIRHNFWLGVGVGKLGTVLDKYVTQRGHGQKYTRNLGRQAYLIPHCEYLVVFAEQGLVGEIMHFGGICFLLLSVYRARRYLRQDSVVMQGFLGLITAFALSCLLLMVSGEFQDAPYLYSLLMVALGLGVRAGELAKDAESSIGSSSDVPGPAAVGVGPRPVGSLGGGVRL